MVLLKESTVLINEVVCSDNEVIAGLFRVVDIAEERNGSCDTELVDTALIVASKSNHKLHLEQPIICIKYFEKSLF